MPAPLAAAAPAVAATGKIAAAKAAAAKVGAAAASPGAQAAMGAASTGAGLLSTAEQRKDQQVQEAQQAAQKAKEGAQIQTGEPMDMAWQMLKGLTEQQMFTTLRNIPERQVSRNYRFMPEIDDPNYDKVVRQGTVHPRAYGMMVAHDAQFGGEGTTGLQRSLRTYSSDRPRMNPNTGKMEEDVGPEGRDVREKQLPETTEGARIIKPVRYSMARPGPIRYVKDLDARSGDTVIPGEERSYAPASRGLDVPRGAIHPEETVNMAYVMQLLADREAAQRQSQVDQLMSRHAGMDMDEAYKQIEMQSMVQPHPTFPGFYTLPSGRIADASDVRRAGYKVPGE